MLTSAHEIAAHIVGIDISEADDDFDLQVVEDRLLDVHGIDFDSFETAVDLLLPYTPTLRTAISDEIVHAFGYLDLSLIHI